MSSRITMCVVCKNDVMKNTMVAHSNNSIWLLERKRNERKWNGIAKNLNENKTYSIWFESLNSWTSYSMHIKMFSCLLFIEWRKKEMKRVCEAFFNAKRLSEKLWVRFCLIVSFAGCYGKCFEEFVDGDYGIFFSNLTLWPDSWRSKCIKRRSLRLIHVVQFSR